MTDSGKKMARSEARTPAVLNGAADALPGVGRLALGTAARSAAWTIGSSVRSGRLLARAIASQDARNELVHAVAEDLATVSGTVTELARAVSAGVPLHKALLEGSFQLSTVVLAEESPTRRPPSLRERGEELLQRSRDVWSDDEQHPAYARILEELAPDEARILMLLLRGGPQPSVDVRTGGPIGMVSSSLVAAGLNMIGPRAGLRYVDQTPAYLNNLFRLGLVWFSTEQLDDPMEYQVVEAQPDVLEAMHSVRYTKVVRRSIHLTPFGINFCRACLVDETEHAELPEHQQPDE